jgi:hypothetical protein
MKRRRGRDLFGPAAVLPRQNESGFQRDVLKMLALILPGDAVVIHVPMGGPNAAWRAKCASLGALPGAPDLIVLWQTRAYAIELKAVDGVRSKDQAVMHDRLRATGIPVFTARTLDGVEDFLRRCNIPLRGRLAA